MGLGVVSTLQLGGQVLNRGKHVLCGLWVLVGLFQQFLWSDPMLVGSLLMNLAFQVA